jgi:hypothetical protein
MQESYEKVLTSPGNLLRPWAMDPDKDGTLTCPSCLGVADLVDEDGSFLCRRCGARSAAPGTRTPAGSTQGIHVAGPQA